MDNSQIKGIILLRGLERTEKYYDILKKWVESAETTYSRWFRETFMNPFFWSAHQSFEDAFKDSIFLKQIYDKMYRPDLYSSETSFEQFLVKIKEENL